MASEISPAEFIQLGYDITSVKLYAMSVTALWCYDYFLTLRDEVAYAWKSKNKRIFVLFLIMRYLPVPFLVWLGVSTRSPSYTAMLCQKTVVLELIYFALITLFAHTVLTLRVYAITGKNKWIAGGLYGLSLAQFGIGVYLCVFSSLHTPFQLPPLNLDAYRMCLFVIPRYGSLLHTSLSLVFDLSAFVIVLVRTRASGLQRGDSNIPNILNAVTRDAAIYFSVIFSSHFLLVLTLIFARPSLRFLPTVGNAVFVPMMIARIIISLKKAASTPPKFELVEISERFLDASHELQEIQGSQHKQADGVFPHVEKRIQPRSDLSNA